MVYIPQIGDRVRVRETDSSSTPYQGDAGIVRYYDTSPNNGLNTFVEFPERYRCEVWYWRGELEKLEEPCKPARA